ncbi:glucose-1-phosphate adenylyltransferase [Gilvimarinus sp. SDUM040013]|uniref:Glucose-1-phosphate adenylyltransferase n=1 Tax=Gilvimarinus gilvus TaxID=3058038 RepID=A0ABU4RYE4_9GAMM|nr:glucose-1-phosphate adenylyltransferase [Gilvimarinus sp. SDUM040013]MDO3385596.1 glucose-1-phosphate adenylyltransferase [Gilvimarinus sp. SDUM040013]MDX6849930.1 glucose-1-phosphate adenylyltransferase [Gilvimarinus sp. SDUM040013]
MSFQSSGRFVSRLTRDTLALVLAGGQGSRLKDLTNWRAKPAVHFGGKFRIIDFPLSNCVNSGIRRISVLTQYKSHSLNRHIQRGWGFLGGQMGEFVELLPAQMRLGESWYAGTADAVFQNLDIIRRHDASYVLILAGDHVYKMDYGTMIGAHVESGADITVGCIEVPSAEASAFGVMDVDEKYNIVKFQEKPAEPESIPGKPGVSLASMGIYVFSTDVLYEALEQDTSVEGSSHDFGKDIIPGLLGQKAVHAFPFKDPVSGGDAYWRDVGTVDALWKSNLELTGIVPELDLYDDEWPIWTYQEHVPPAKFIFDDSGRRGMAVDSMVAGGCIVSGSTVRHSLLFPRVRVHSYAEVIDSVLFPKVDIGRHCKIKKALIDRDCVIPEGMEIGYDEKRDSERFYVSPGGVVLVTPEMLAKL